MIRAPRFNEVKVGDSLPTLNLPKISRHTLALYCGGSGDHNPLHTDSDFARASGLSDVIAHGMLIMAYVGQVLTSWVQQSALRSFEARFQAMTQVDDLISCSGEVTEKFDEDHSIRVALIARSSGNTTVVAEAVVTLA